MANNGFILPNNNATFRYSFRDTGGSWPDDVLMVGGNKDTFNPFVSPVCDELRITITYEESYTPSRFHLTKLNIVSGLTFAFSDTGGTVLSDAPLAQDPPTNRRNYHWNLTAPASTELTLIITGINQQRLNIGQVTVGRLAWTPSKNYSNGAEVGIGNAYQRSESFGGVMQQISSKARSHNVTYERLTDDEYKSLKHLIDYQSKGGLVVYEKDTASLAEDESYLAYIKQGKINEQIVDENSFSVDIIEAIT